MTEENHRAPGYKDRQEEVELCGKKVWADPELIPLLKALNDVGLQTRSHCCGHGTAPAWVAIRLDSINGVEIRTDANYRELLITWRPNARSDRRGA